MVRVVLPVFQERQYGHGHVTRQHKGRVNAHEYAEYIIEPLKHNDGCL